MNAPSEPRRLSDLTPQQRKSGFAAWLGWMFDGLDMHIYTLVASVFVAVLLFSDDIAVTFRGADGNGDGTLSSVEWMATADSNHDGMLNAAELTQVRERDFASADQNRDGRVSAEEFEVFEARKHTGKAEVNEKSSWIQAAFLVGWALGGAFFGRLGDLLGRSRALSLTVLTYALFTGLSFFAETWWHLMIFRFLAALGIGGEWAVGSTLLSETWPKSWRPWTAAVLQTGVNIGVLIACLAGVMLSGFHPRWIFLIGVVPAVLVFYIRRHVPEPAAWKAAHENAPKPSVLELFRGSVRRATFVSIGVCAFSLTGWWAFMYWQAQLVRRLPEVVTMSPSDINTLVATTFFLIIGVSIGGNFFAGFLARRFGYKTALVVMFAGFTATMCITFGMSHSLGAFTKFWLPAVGFWSGVFGLFTMLMPPLFPTLLRTTGAGFCYNIGRIAAAAGTIFAAHITGGGDFRRTLFYVGFLFVPAAIFTLFLPSEKEGEQI